MPATCDDTLRPDVGQLRLLTQDDAGVSAHGEHVTAS
ncbi:hypothetical protein ACVLV4_000162 [Rathayibacter agropyri]